MTAEDVLKTVADMPHEEWMKIQRRLAEMISAQFTSSESEEIRQALAESEAEFGRGEGLDEEAARRRLGLA
jgi:predicted metal-binding transcription factor (methanogenesis marker protein 9)